MNAKKEPITGEDALRLATEVHEIFATRGKSVIHVHLAKEKPNRETLSKLLLGPTGNLRAPALRVGKTLVVGFDEGVYREVLGEKDKRSI